MKLSENIFPPRRRSELLLNVVFLAALVLLIVNDHFWKASYSNVLTGKLSDLAGLVLLPLCLVYVFPRLQESAVLWSALFFFLWKTPLATPFIEYYNLVAPIPISRVVDYTDYLAFVILPLPWWMIKQPQQFEWSMLRLKPVAWSWGLLLLTSMSFVATSPPRWYYTVADAPGNVRFYQGPYEVKKSPEEVLARLREEGIAFEPYLKVDSTGGIFGSYARDSAFQALYQFYVIPQLILEEDTLNDIHFALSSATSDYTHFQLQSMNIPDSSSTYIVGKTNKWYLKVLKKELVRKVRR